MIPAFARLTRRTWPLLRCYSASFWFSEPWKSALTLVGVTLAIALFVGIQLANEAALSSFRSSAGLLRGGADFELSDDSGEIAEDIIPTLRSLSAVAELEPASRRVAEARNRGTSLGPVEVLGMNVLGAHRQDSRSLMPERQSVIALLKDSTSCLISEALAAKLQGPLELDIRGRIVQLTPRGTLPKSPFTTGLQVVLDIAAFQDLFETWGYVDTLQLYLRPEVEREAAEREIQAALGSRLHLRTEHQSSRHATIMTEAFRLNLQFLSSIALFVALLLIYNTLSFFILKRRKDFAALRAIGVSSKQVRFLIIFEALVLGISSSVLGLAIGFLMNRSGLRLINSTLQGIYGQVAADTPVPSAAFVAAILMLGSTLSVLGSVLPMQDVLSRPVREGFSVQLFEQHFSNKASHFAFLGLLLMVACWLTAQPALLQHDTRLGFLSPTIAVFACCLLIPWSLVNLLRGLRFLFRRSIPTLLAADHVLNTPQRNSVAVASISVSLAMGFALTVMIASFRDTVSRWITSVTRADIFISGQFGPTTSLASSLAPATLEALRELPEVLEYDPISTKTVDWNGRFVRVAGCRMEIIRDFDRLLFQEPMDFQARARAIAQPETIFVSEVFSRRTGKRIGDWIEIPGRHKSFRGRIANIFYDYSSDQGVIVVPLSVFQEMNGVLPFQGVTLYLRNPERLKEVVATLQSRFAGQRLKIRDNRTLRTEVLRIFDETFRITYVLQAISLFISAAALMNTLSMLALERMKEFSVIRAIGASSRTITTMVAAESLILTIAGLLAGLVLGSILSVILVYVVNSHFFGWSIGLQLPVLPIASAAAFALVLAWLLGEAHGRRIVKNLSGASLRYE